MLQIHNENIDQNVTVSLIKKLKRWNWRDIYLWFSCYWCFPPLWPKKHTNRLTKWIWNRRSQCHIFILRWKLNILQGCRNEVSAIIMRNQAFTNCVHGYDRVSNIHAKDITENLCTILIPVCKHNLNLPISHTDQYAFKNKNHYHSSFNFQHSSPESLQP